MSGNLFMLFLESEKNSKDEWVVKDLKVELLGWYSIEIRTKMASVNDFLFQIQVKYQFRNALRTWTTEFCLLVHATVTRSLSNSVRLPMKVGPT